MFRNIIGSAVILGLSACASVPHIQADARGPISPMQLQHDFPVFTAKAAEGKDIEQLRAALAAHPDVELKVFFGTWCGDSQRELPKLFGLLAQVPAEQFALDLHAQPRAKHERTQIYQDFKVGPLPSILLLRNGVEIGRIVEQPKTTLVEDLIALINAV